MATYYISKAGNDSWDGTSLTFVSGSTGPKLTLSAGLVTLPSNGDTVYINDGTYTENVSTLTKAITILPVNDYMVTIQRNTSGTNTLTTSNTTGTYTFGKIIIDGETNGLTTGAAIQCGNGANTTHNVVFNGTRILEGKVYGIRDLLTTGSVTATGITITRTAPNNTTQTASSVTSSATTATFNLNSHGYAAGTQITIAGADQSEYNGTYTIATASANSFTYTFAGSATTPATGTITVTGELANYAYHTSLSHTSGTVTIQNSTITKSANCPSSYGIYCLPQSLTGDGSTITLIVSGNLLNITNASATLSFYYGIRAWNTNNYSIYNNTISMYSPNAIGQASDSINMITVEAYNNTPTYEAHTMSGNIYGNYLYHYGSGGIMITIGGDGYIANGAGKVTDADIYSNYIEASSNATDLHGIMQAQQNGGRIYGNLAVNVPLAFMFKGQDGGVMSGNIAVNSNGIGGQYASLRIKGARNTTVTNNTVINTASPTYVGGIGDMYQENESSGRYSNSTGIVWQNNIIQNAGATAAPYRSLNSSQTATFYNNNYWMPSASSITYTYNGTNRTSFSAWQSNVESTATNINSSIRSDYRVPPDSDLVHAGYAVPTNARDYYGNSFEVSPTIGAIEYTEVYANATKNTATYVNTSKNTATFTNSPQL